MKNFFFKDNYKTNFHIYFFIIIPIIIRIIFFYFYGSSSVTFEWRVLLENFKNHGVIGIHVFDGSETIMKTASLDEKVLPSVFMPPFYIFFLITINFFLETISQLVTFVIFFQIFISIISALFLFNLLKEFFSRKISLLGTAIFLYFPLNIYSSVQISSITLQIFFLIIFFFFFFLIIKKDNIKYIIFFSISSSALLLLRGEFVAIFFLTLLILFFKKKKIKEIILSLFLTLVLISPYIIRNYITFNEIVIVKSFGYNLWKGNNENSKPQGREIINDQIIEKIKNLKPNNSYEMLKDEIFKEEAIHNIYENPNKYLKLFIKKIFSFWFFDNDSFYQNYFHPAHIVPKILIGLTTLFGILCFKKSFSYNYFVFIFIINLLLFSVFFILPRYQLAILPIQIILSCNFFEAFFKLKKSFK